MTTRVKLVKIYVPIIDNPKEFSFDDLPPDMKKCDVAWGRYGSEWIPCRIAYGTEEAKKEIEDMYDRVFKSVRRADRCLLHDKKGGFVRCNERNSCRLCRKMEERYFSDNKPMSLDSIVFGEDNAGIEIPDRSFSIDVAVDFVILESLLDYLETIDPLYRDMFQMLYDLETVSEIARILNMPRSTVDDIVKKIRKLAIDFLKITK